MLSYSKLQNRKHGTKAFDWFGSMDLSNNILNCNTQKGGTFNSRMRSSGMSKMMYKLRSNSSFTKERSDIYKSRGQYNYDRGNTEIPTRFKGPVCFSGKEVLCLPRIKADVHTRTKSGLIRDGKRLISNALLLGKLRRQTVDEKDLQLHIYPGPRKKPILEKFFAKDSVVYAQKRKPLPYVMPHTQIVRLLADPSTVYIFPELPDLVPPDSEQQTQPRGTSKAGTTPEKHYSQKYSIILKSRTPSLHALSKAEGKLRRPTLHPPEPMSQNDTSFLTLASENDLQQIYVGDAEVNTFYDDRFPLLMQLKKLLTPDIEEIIIIPSENTPPPLGPNMAKRTAMLRGTVSMQTDQLTTLIDELSLIGIGVTTELNSDVFDPMKWTWNKDRYRC